MKVSQQTIQAVQQVVRIEEVIADFIPLKKKGQNLWACCPFHHENTPSFSVSPAKGFYKCFGCDAAGDAITFIQQINGSTFIEAITDLAQRYGITMDMETNFQNQQDLQLQNTKESLYILLNMAKQYYANLLWTDPEASTIALPYLQQRAIPEAVAKKFELGYSLNHWDAFYKFATQQGVSVDLLHSAGLVIKNETKIYDRFRGRLMFPIHNSTGQVVAFGARQIGNTVINSAKYINSPETPIYHKGGLLYGLSLAKEQIRRINNCYLVEGYTDVLAFHMAGVEQVVASAGTSLTAEQMDYLRRFTATVTLIFDGDQAGIQAALRGGDKLLCKGFQLKVVVLPPGEDPASYAYKVGAAALMQYIQKAAQDFITFKAGFLLNQAPESSPAEQAKSIRDIVQSIANIPDEIERHLFLKKCSKLFAVEEEVIWTTYRALQSREKPIPLPYAAKKKCPTSHDAYGKQDGYVGKKQLPFKNKLTTSIEAYEREIIRILLTYGHAIISEEQRLYTYILTELHDLSFRSDPCKKIYDYFLAMLKKDQIVDLQFCLNHGAEEIKKIAIDLTASPHDISKAWIEKYGIYTATEAHNLHQMTLEVILRLKIRLVQELIEQNREALKQDGSIEEELKLLQVHQLLKDTESTMAKQLGSVVVQ